MWALLVGVLAMLAVPAEAVDPTNDPNYEAFVVTDKDKCAEGLPYGREYIDRYSKVPKVSTLYANVMHTAWEQVLDPGDGTGIVYITWTFSDELTMAHRFYRASKYGESVTWTVTYGSNTYTLKGSWRWTSNPGTDYLTRFGGTGTAFSGDDGAWGAAVSKAVDGDANAPTDFWGQANFDGSDSGCDKIYYGSDTGTVKTLLINRIFVKVNSVDPDDISSEWVKGDYGGYDPASDTVSSYRFKIEGNNDRNLYLYRMDSLTAPTSATDDAFFFGVDVLGDSGNSYLTVDYTPSTALNLVGGHCLVAWQFWVHPTYGFRTETTPSQYCWTKESHDGYGKCTYHTSLNGAVYASTNDESRSLTDLPDGTNTFSVYATDMYGNAEPGLASSFTWTVDTSAPTVSLHQDTALVTETSRTFNWEAGESNSYYKYQIDDGVTSFTTEESMAFAAGSFAVSSCSGTSHSFAVAAIDAVGNVGSYKTKAFTVEPINTALTLDNAAVETTVSGTSATFTVSAVVDTSSTTSFTFQYALDGGVWTKGSSTTFTVAELTDGEHTLAARAIDSSGCKDPSPVELSFFVDSVAPVVVPVWPASPLNAASVVVTGTVEDADPSEVYYKLVTADSDSGYTPAVTSGAAFSIPLDSLTVEGAYTLMVFAVDRAGHTGAVVSWDFTVDFGAPESMVRVGPPSPMRTDETALFVMACSEISCEYMASLDGGAYAAVDGDTLMLTDLAEGMHTLRMYAVDVAGNVDATPAAYTWSVYADDMYASYAGMAYFTVDGYPTDYVAKDVTYNHVDETIDPTTRATK